MGENVVVEPFAGEAGSMSLHPLLVFTHASSDLVVGVVFLLAAFTIAFLLRREPLRPKVRRALGAFAVLLALVSASFIVGVIALQTPLYALETFMKVATAVAAVVTAATLPPLAPQLLQTLEDAADARRRQQKLEVAHSQLRSLYERLRSVEDSRTRFLANVSHELRTPLTLILGSADQLHDECTTEGRRLARAIVQSAQLLNHNVDELLVLAQHDAGALRPRYARVDLGNLLRRCLTYFEGVAKARHLSIDVRIANDATCDIDPEMIERILLNLVFNAVKHTPAGGIVRCAASVDDDNDLARVMVADSGPGIPAGQELRIFEPFTRLEGGPRTDGTGLGLAISRDLAALHGGTLAAARSLDLGGAELTLSLPRFAHAGTVVESPRFDGTLAQRVAGVAATELGITTEPAPPMPRNEPLAGEASTRPSVVIIEDSTDMRRFVHVGLQSDFRVRSASDGEAGLALIQEDPPDLVVTDLMMPGLGGAQVIRALRSDPKTADAAVLVLTAREDPAVRLELLEEGADDFVTKPFRMRELKARARNLARNKRARDLLRVEVTEQSSDLESLAQMVAQRRRELSLALDAAHAARDVAESASRAKSNFIRMMSHELRTPLTALQLQIRLLERDAVMAERPSAKLQIQRLSRSANQLLMLIDGVLQFARLEAGRLVIQVEHVRLYDVAKELVKVFESHAEEKGIRLLVDEKSEEPGALPTDARLVRLVLSNLVSNAVKYTREGSVTLSVHETRQGQTVQVRDTGPGIPDDKIAEVFEPFAQLGDLRERAGMGSGLGLALVKDLAAALGGRIALETASGKGSVFTLHLPKAPPDRSGPIPVLD